MIADPAHVRTVGNLPDAVVDDVIYPHLRTASRRLKNWVGDSNYTSAESEVSTARANLNPGESLDINTLSELAQALIDAEAYLAMCHGLPTFNMVMQDDSGVASSGKIGEGQYSYLTAQEVEVYQEIFLHNAVNAAKNYIQQTKLETGISPAFDDEGEEI